MLKTFRVVTLKKGTDNVSKLKFVFVEFDVNPAAIMFVVVRVFETTKFANGCVIFELWMFERVFPKMRVEERIPVVIFEALMPVVTFEPLMFERVLP